MTKSIKLYRPLGLFEAKLIIESAFKEFPPRLEGQPIFYPVLNEEYAIQIARDWNTKEAASGYSGFVSAFDLDKDYYDGFEIQQVGDDLHKELWVPAEDLRTFNHYIIKEIQIINSFYGDRYEGIVPTKGPLAGKNTFDQLLILYKLHRDNYDSFCDEITASLPTCFLNYEFWRKKNYSETIICEEKKTQLLIAIQNVCLGALN